MTPHDFHVLFVNGHIVAGSIGLIAFWVPVIGRKGGKNHRRWGQVFIWSMIAVGFLAIGISTATLVDPVGTHPGPGFDFPPEILEGIFGWMMLYLSILTINLAWYGRECVRNKYDHSRNKTWLNWMLQVVLLIAATNTAVRGVLLEQPLMIGISTIGFATVFTNGYFMLRQNPDRDAWLREHLKGLVGAGISVYTAFFAFGAVRLMPELALSPLLWSVPLVTGLSIIFWHWWDIHRKAQARQVKQRQNGNKLAPVVAD